MRIVKRAKVYLIGRTEPVVSQINEFLRNENLDWPTPNNLGLVGPHEDLDPKVRPNETLIELFGRCCYMSFGKKAGSANNLDYLDNLIGLSREGIAHGSVTEHINFNLLVVGGGRGFSHEQVRHRVGWAYSQLSTRYCDFEREDEDGSWDPGFVIPPLAQIDEATVEFMTESIVQARKNYTTALHKIEAALKEKFKDKLATMNEREGRTFLRKAARGVARDLLPISTEAIMGMTGNCRSIWNSIVMRASEAAEASIRDIYVQIAQIMEQELPHVYKGLEYKKAWDGTDYVVMPREKL